MSESKYRLMKFLSQFTKVFCVAHAGAAILLMLLVDVEPNYVRVLACMAYCMAISCLMGVSHCLIRDAIDEALGYE